MLVQEIDIIIKHDNEEYRVSPRLEGLYNPCGFLKGYELLSDVVRIRENEKIEPRAFFHSLNVENLSCILFKQVELIIQLVESLTPEIVISFNLDDRGLAIINADVKMLSKLKKYRANIRVEIDEEFDFKMHHNQLEIIHDICGLWLDDFGKGDYVSQDYYSYLFHGVKIDKDFTSRIIHLPNGIEILNKVIVSLKKLFPKVIVEGVSDHEIACALSSSKADLLQGWFWKKQVVKSQQISSLIKIKL